MKWRDKNFGKSPFDPDYDDSFDKDFDYARYSEVCAEREEQKREK